MQQYAPLQRALPNGSDFLGHPMARKIAHGHDNLETDQIRPLKRPLSNLAHRGSGCPLSRRTRSDPVAQICPVVRLVNLIEPTATQVSSLAGQDGKLERGSLFERRNLNLEPGPGIRDRVRRMTPWHPWLKLSDRLAYCFQHDLGVVQAIGPYENVQLEACAGTYGPMDPWTHGPMDPHEPMDLYGRCSSGTQGCGTGGPVYSARGRIRRLFANCSRTCAVQPDVRLTAKIGV